jgi:hypothetical protein
VSPDFVAPRDGEEVRSARPRAAILRSVGRVALWAVLAILLIRGGAAILEPAGGTPPTSSASPISTGAGQTADSLAAGFARAYLESPSPTAFAPYLAEGVHLDPGHPPAEAGAVAQAEVVRSASLGGDRWVLTVSCDLRDSRVLNLAVPIVRKRAGEAAVIGAPSIVAVPAPAGASPERPRPIAGAGAGAIEELAAKFLPAYAKATRSSELSYLVSPGAAIVPMGGSLELVSTGRVRQVEDGEGPSRELLVAARLRDPASGVTYPLIYRLQAVERSRRWYVTAVEGAVA